MAFAIAFLLLAIPMPDLKFSYAAKDFSISGLSLFLPD
jgi:hypothetical protein